MQHRRQKEVLFGGGLRVIIAHEARAIFLGHTHLIEVQRSLVAIGGASCCCKKMVGKVHYDRFLKLF